MPFGTDVTALAPTYTVSPLALQDATSPSGTIRNFSTQQTYTVTAENGSTKDYTVTVTVAAASSAKDILTCNFGALGAATISGTSITVYAPPTQSLTSLAPAFTLSPFATLSPLSGIPQDFTNPVSYTVTAQNGSTKVYTVAVTTYQSWNYSGSLYILTTPDGANLPASAATETNFPLLVRLNSGNFPFSQAQSDGRDLRFATAAGAMLSYQIEQWDAVNGKAAVWVKIPAITGNARQEIIMYWGKSGVATASSGSSVFSSSNGYASVHHMSDTLADTVGTTTPANNSTTATNGLIGRARSFAAGQGIQCGTAITGLPTGSGPFSTGVWIRPSTSGNVLLGWGLEQGQGKVIVNLTSPPRIRVDGYFGGADISGTAAIPTSEWSYVVQTFQSTACKLYVNGVLDASTGGGLMNMPTPCRFDIGGFVPTHGYNFVGDMDEVRISNVVRSANWVKLEYENQKPVQTLVGGIVPSGSDFSVTPTSVTMNEATTTTLTAQAGGAQKVYWIYVKNGQETLLATDQLTFNYTAPRISGNDSATIRFKAVFAAGPQIIDVPLTVLDTVPDPVFTLTPSTTSWDGRQTMTVTANISNLTAMQAAGFGTLKYKWTVSGVAVIKQTSNGTLTLTRSQGSGPMTASLTIDNGGALVTNSVVINVQEPASDPWVQRTPAANEKPVNKQFFARDPGTGLGTIHYRGTQSGATDVYLKVYTTDTGADVLYATHRQTLAGGAYSFAAPIAAGKMTYKVTYGTTTTGGVDNPPSATVSDLICGDAFIIEGQSNALATDNTAPNDTVTTNKWVRTYGLTSGWGYAISKGNDLQLGLWGWYLANRLVANNNMPVCIINGAIGGTRIDVHRPNPANHSLPLGTGWGENSYADLYNRIVGAKLTHGIRAVLWHQGEQDQGVEGPDGDYDYKFYQQYFVDISAAWKQDFPNLQKYYLFQIWPAACGSMSNGSDDKLREKQRTLPYLYSNMRIMSTLGIVPGSGCHYEPAGYQVFSDLIGPLVEQDNYGYLPGSVFTAPDLKKAYFTTSAHTGITLEFDQNMAWNTGASSLLFLDGVANKVASGSVSGKVIKLTLTAASTASTITYLQGTGWNGVQGNLLYGTNSIAALTFADVPLALPPPMGLTAVQNNNQVVLNWTAPSSGATGYKIKRSLKSGSGYVQINTAAGTTFTDTDVTNGTTYYYVVSATNGSDEGTNSEEASVTLIVIGTGVTTTTLVRHSGTGNSTTYGDALSFDVTVSGSSTPTGLVTLKDGGAGGTTIGSTTLAGGTCTIASALTALTPGSHDNLVAVYSGDINFASNTSGALDTQTVSPKALTVTGTAVTSKTYNGTTAATLTGATLSGVVGGDTVTLGNATSGTFNSKDAGTGKTVTPAMTISGSSAGYYTLTQPVLTGTITPKALTVTGTTVATKPYDGSTAAALAGGTLSGVVGGDEVTLNASGTFNTKDVGTGKVVTSTSTLAGAQKANYTLTQPTGLTGTITALVVTLSGSRTYDGTTNVAAASLAIGNKVGGEDLSLSGSASLAGKDVGSQALVSGTLIMRVQAATGNTGTSAATTINVTLGTIPTNGNTLVAVIATRGTTADRVSGISGGGVTWTRVSQAVNAGGTTTEIWYGPNVSNGTKAVSITQAALFSAAVVMEYGGLLAPASFDVVANNTGNSTTASTGATATTAQAYELCVGGIGLLNSGYTLDSPNNSFAAVASAKSTNTTAGSNSVVYALEKILTATGTASSGGTVSTSSQWSGAMATFKAVQAVPTPGVPMRVQSATGNTGASAATTIAVNMVTAPANGNTMIAVISTRGTSSDRVTSITQTGAAWTRAVQTANANGTTTEIWYAPNVAAAAAAVTINQASLLSAAVVLEYSGVLAVSPLDKTASITGSSTAAATGTTVATTQAIELWIGGSGLVSSSYTLGNPNNSFTAVASAQSAHTTAASNAKVYALERIVGGTGTASSGGTVSTSSQWSGAIATFKAAATLTLGGAAAANYTLIGATGTLAITPADLTITADNQSKTYGQSVTFGSGSTQFTSNGLQNGETIGSVTLACDGGGAAAEAASYPITPGAATAGTFSAANYAISYVPGTLTVNNYNRPPVFSSYAISTPYQTLATVSLSKLLAMASDPDGDAISVTAAGPASAQGGTAALLAAGILYTPSNGFSGADTFPVTLTDARGAATSGTVTVTVGPAATGGGTTVNPPVITLLDGGHIGLKFQGIPGRNYQIQRSTDMSAWTTLVTVTANATGTMTFTDENPPQSSAFYRLALP